MFKCFQFGASHYSSLLQKAQQRRWTPSVVTLLSVYVWLFGCRSRTMNQERRRERKTEERHRERERQKERQRQKAGEGKTVRKRVRKRERERGRRRKKQRTQTWNLYKDCSLGSVKTCLTTSQRDREREADLIVRLLCMLDGTGSMFGPETTSSPTTSVLLETRWVLSPVLLCCGNQ